MEDTLFFEDIFKPLVEEVQEIEIVYDYIVGFYKDDSYLTYEIKTINGKYPFSFKRKIQSLGKEGLTILNEELKRTPFEHRIGFLEEIKEELVDLKSIVEDEEMIIEESEWGPREVHKFKAFRNSKLLPFSEERTKGSKKSILRKASEYVESYTEAIDEIARKIDFLINHIELLPEPKEVIKDKNTIRIFYSWQSDRNESKKSIWKALNELEKELKKEGKTLIIESDSREMPGSQDIPNNLFRKIMECDIFIADVIFVGLNIYKDETGGLKKMPNSNVMIELGFAAGVLGWDRVIIVLDTRYFRIEELPFDIRQRTICWYDSAYDNLNNKLKSFVRTMIEK